MYICYADESGYAGAVIDERQRYLVMAAVLANTYNMHRTQTDFGEIVDEFQHLTGRAFREMKAEELYGGRGAWAAVVGEQRHAAYERVLRWFAARRHHVTFSAIDTRIFFALLDGADELIRMIQAPYVACALHVGLMIQRRHQHQSGNKGKTLIIFDQQGEFEFRIAELLSDPPGWTDAYYGHQRGDRLDQIVDTAYFVRSHHASLIQLADLIALVLRRHAGLNDGGDAERFPGERDRVARWIEILRPRLFERAHRLPPGNDRLAALYRRLCPPSLAGLAA